ncbi:glycosyltransferase family 2 protein [Microbacterium sp. 4R-513]|uniref:glycosyltransferase n=1 Tax=Microbacterium sp. 4R-513 TaxID=2567934 RepID=UPI0013E1E183|nr:glycosyltransferase family 2 protein [Microbacterium sp. 4R-513]QIG39887.1 glycosyltransferase family 2 protein [Microbacterium sp. 4R-513]
MAAPSVDDRPTVSVVIPVKDDDTELARCLAALAAQTRRADEIVVVDNGSTDASASVARAAGVRLERCDRPGIPAASARGYDAAEGDLILRLDADCVPDERWIEAVVRTFDRRPEAGAATGGARFIDGPRALRGPLAVVYLGSYGAVAGLALGHRALFGSNLAMRREVWRGIRHRVHRADASVHDDFDLSFHVGERWRIARVPGALMGVSMRPFGDPRAFAHRVAAGFRTVTIHWPHDFPPVRWLRVVLRRAGVGLHVPAASRVGAAR